MTAAIVPAAGRSARFGSPKLIADVEGQPLLNHTLRCLIDAGVDRVVVVLSPTARLDGVTLLGHPAVRTVVNPDPSRGMLSSIQAGAGEVSGADVLVVLPADMPFVQSATVSAVVAEARRTGRGVLPTSDGRHGHPIALPGRVVEAIGQASQGSTLKAVLIEAGVPLDELTVHDPGVLRDVDVRDDLRP
jgi:molybdenum cofactor cytidylyltransferase